MSDARRVSTREGDAAQDAPCVRPLSGTYVWDVVDDRWWWSDELYALHGFAPGEVLPSTDLLMAHRHPDDQPKLKDVLEDALHQGGRFSCYHRVLDSHRQVHHVLLVGGATRDEHGRVVQLSGFMADLSDVRRQELQPSVDEAIGDVLEHRGMIDMAKGAIMLGYGITADAAFQVLRSTSNNSNIKVHELAQRLVREMAMQEEPPARRSRIDALLARITDPDYAHLP